MAKPSNRKPASMVDAWHKELLMDRLEACRAMLRIHGMLSFGENQNVKRRIDKKRREDAQLQKPL